MHGLHWNFHDLRSDLLRGGNWEADALETIAYLVMYVVPKA